MILDSHVEKAYVVIFAVPNVLSAIIPTFIDNLRP